MKSGKNLEILQGPPGVQSSVLTIIHCMAHYVDLQATTQTINSGTGTFQYYTTSLFKKTTVLSKRDYIVKKKEHYTVIFQYPYPSSVSASPQPFPPLFFIINEGQCIFFPVVFTSPPATTVVIGSYQIYCGKGMYGKKHGFKTQLVSDLCFSSSVGISLE
jgi:hypothetical protein